MKVILIVFLFKAVLSECALVISFVSVGWWDISALPHRQHIISTISCYLLLNLDSGTQPFQTSTAYLYVVIYFFAFLMLLLLLLLVVVV